MTDNRDQYNKMKREKEQLEAKQKKPCSKCGNPDVLRFPGMGVSFYYCSKCSQEAQDKAEAQYKDLPSHIKENDDPK